MSFVLLVCNVKSNSRRETFHLTPQIPSICFVCLSSTVFCFVCLPSTCSPLPWCHHSSASRTMMPCAVASGSWKGQGLFKLSMATIDGHLLAGRQSMSSIGRQSMSSGEQYFQRTSSHGRQGMSSGVGEAVFQCRRWCDSGSSLLW